MHVPEEIHEIQDRAQRTYSRYEAHWTGRLVRNYLDDDADGLASILAFAAMFSLMPILIVTFSLVTILSQLDVVQKFLDSALAEDIPPYIDERVSALLHTGDSNLATLGIATLVTFLLGGSKLYSAMDRACARIFRVERRAYASRKLFSVVMMPLIPLLLLLTTVVSSVATALLTLPLEQILDIEPGTKSSVIGYLVALLLAFVLMLLAYRRIPEDGPGVADAAVGAAVAAVLIVLLAQFFPLYIKITGGYSIYGAIFAFALLILFWLYLMGQIFVIGAEIAAYRANRRIGATSHQGDEDAAEISEIAAQE